MSFNFQGPSERPIIQGAQNMMNNGGGGNLGYFQGRQKKKDEEKSTLFGKDEEDTFTLSSGEGDLTNQENLDMNGPMDTLKDFWKKITGKKEEEN